MTAATCRACGGPFKSPHHSQTINAVEVRLITRQPGKRRMGDFALCPRCVWQATSGGKDLSIAITLAAELKALLR